MGGNECAANGDRGAEHPAAGRVPWPRSASRSASRSAARPVARRRTLLAVGGFGEVARLARGVRDDALSGWDVTAACTPTAAGPGGAAGVDGVPVQGDLDDVARLAGTGAFDAVVVLPAPGCTAVRFTRLAARLLGGRTIVLADPFLVADPGPRVRAAMIAGVPLLRLTDTGPTRARRAREALLGAVGVRPEDQATA